MDTPTTSTASSVGRVLLKTLVILALTVFTLMGLCGGVFSVIDLSSGKAGHNEYIGPIPYISLAVGVAGAWACWWLFRRLRRPA